MSANGDFAAAGQTGGAKHMWQTSIGNTSNISRIFGVILLAGTMFMAGPVAAQQNITCTSTLSSGIFENVSVPKNASCTLNSGVTVLSNVIVGSGATLQIFGARIAGNVVANDANTIVIRFGATVGGNVQLVGTMSWATVGGSTIGGNINIVGTNPGNVGIEIIFNDVAGSVIFAQNNAAFVGVLQNTIGMNLVCVGNSPAPTDFNLPNTVNGNKIGQCAGL
jgi:hypothetical protein